MNSQCSSCRFYRVDPRNLKQGTCRFNPPMPAMISSPTGQPISIGMFSPVQENEWWGSSKLISAG